MKTVLMIGVLIAGAVGCTQLTQSEEPVAREGAALSGVQNCQAQAQTCVEAATSATDIAACDQQLKSCLEALCDDAGLPPITHGAASAQSAPRRQTNPCQDARCQA